MRIALLTCALFAAACGGNDNRPAQDPSTTPSSTTVTAAPASMTPAANDTTTTTTGTTSTLSAAGTTGMGTPGLTPSPAASPATDAPVANDPSAANVANDPGAHDQTKNADNTRINDRDRHGTLTPMSQGNSGSEIKITAAIRRGVMGDKSLSFTAKNVKIITVGTKVTLRGPVNTDQERSAIESRAKQTPGVTDVDDQIEVKK